MSLHNTCWKCKSFIYFFSVDGEDIFWIDKDNCHYIEKNICLLTHAIHIIKTFIWKTLYGLQNLWVMWHGFTAMIIPAFIFVLIWMMIGHELAQATGEIARSIRIILNWKHVLLCLYIWHRKCFCLFLTIGSFRFLEKATAKIVGITIFFVLCLGPFSPYFSFLAVH